MIAIQKDRLLHSLPILIQAILLPLITLNWLQDNMSGTIVWLLLMALCIAGIQLDWFSVIWLIGLVVASFGLFLSQPQVIWLILAQLGMTLVLMSQTLSPAWRDTLTLLQLFFFQALFVIAVVQILPNTLLLDLLLLDIPLLLVIWIPSMAATRWLLPLTLVIYAIGAYFSTRLTLLSIAGIVLISWLWAHNKRLVPYRLWLPVIYGLLFWLVRLHG
ncbi:hypothetical protein [Lacticaseibacillus saniviri]|uniref:Uncharacterized protein n=1 Tax=Lacticaseibacillus saniviri JCM 17471 = DSM 24301 TaxID=1293598 RepID=A0A0R2MTB8_9LACO|nr:hypothetical protein [Lacticaseibacillus saniviri]KRO16805.1 hypothetical protein IV56_GL000794 [Lacticaseibacillus saniviri JCM 17471 = DSM 24301]MCG4283089.1 hypothetical protein [Lacticaseibacillus saniviri]